MYQAGIYCRISIEEQNKEGEYSNSIHSQIQMARDYIAENKDIAEKKVYVDDGASGSNFERTEFRRMLADIELGVINMVIFKDVYLELKQMYETENQKYQKELSELNHEEQRQRAAVNETKIWLEHFNRRRITVKQLTREALVELVDKIYVYPEQKIDIYFKFASVESSPDRILEKDGVI